MEKVKLGPKTLLYPMPAVLVGVKVGEKPNFMTAAWCSIAALKPPALSVSIQKKRYTMKGIKEYGVFSINVPSIDLMKKVDYCGIYSGKKRDKSQIFQIFYGILEAAPLIQDCPFNTECRVIHSIDLGSNTLVVGEIIETYINKDCMADGEVDPVKIDPLAYIPGTMEYQRMGEIIGKAFHIGKEK